MREVGGEVTAYYLIGGVIALLLLIYLGFALLYPDKF
ncbi:MAG TPA: K(+)-transporting ATPase subunit F [Fimbriimonadaceae bacterium]|nr:K(+)-transporting ATPase subunit F [Fimbriimonadaceae bacterium]